VRFSTDEVARLVAAAPRLGRVTVMPADEAARSALAEHFPVYREAPPKRTAIDSYRDSI
jgi:hypothetical protein